MKYQYAVERVLDHFPDLTARHVISFLRRATFVNVARQYMYYSIPKAACTQMREILRDIENAPPIKLFADGDWQTRRDMFIHARSNVPLPSLVDVDNSTQREVLESPEFLRLTVVRNPYTRLVSAWKNKVVLCEPSVKGEYRQIKGGLPDLHAKSLVTFDEFVEYAANRCDLRTCDGHWRRQVDYAFFPAMNFSYVGKLEHFEDVLRRLEQHLGLSETLVAERRNQSLSFGNNPYTKELADKVYALYQSDFEVLGYNYNSWATDRHKSQTKSTNSSLSLDQFLDEIVERNLILSSLYEETGRLNAQLRWVSRLYLAPAFDGLFALHSISRRAVRKVERWARRIPRRRRRMKTIQVVRGS
jgi:hypothetical protein